MPDADWPVAAVVLAAGSSRRMGRNKLLLTLGAETVVRRAVRSAIEAGIDRIAVVLGHEAERVEGELSGLRCDVVVNLDHDKGVGTSVRAGVRHFAGEARALVVLLADMPFVDSAMIAAVVERYRASLAPLVVSQYGDVQAPPTLYDRSLFGELLAVGDEQCAKRVVRSHMKEAEVLAWPSASLQDLDLATDYERVCARF